MLSDTLVFTLLIQNKQTECSSGAIKHRVIFHLATGIYRYTARR